MKIFSVQSQNFANTKIYTGQNNCFKQTETCCSDNFAKFNYSMPVFFKGYNKNFAIDKLSEFSIKEYKKLSPVFLRKLRQECAEILYSGKMRTEMKDIEEKHEIASDLIIDALNREYGTDNWVLISLGRSVSSISKVIGYKIGEDNVKQLPMTRANRFFDDRAIRALESTDDLKGLKEYLNSIGLDEKSVAESGKNYILLDYCHSGGSLLGGYKLLTSNLLFGTNLRIHMTNVMNLIPKENPIYSQLNECFYKSKFKDYSEVKQCLELKETADAVFKINEYPRDSKLMKFKLLDNVMSK